MSIEDNTNIDATQDDNLDDFAAELFGDGEAAPDNAKSEDVKADPTEESDAPTKTEDAQPTDETHQGDDPSEDDDTLATEEENDDTDDSDAGNKKPQKRNRFQERIDELVARAAAAERELELVKAQQKDNKADETKANDKAEDKEATSTAPDFKAKNPDGTDKYPLGEYDPQYIKDTVQHMLDEREAAQKKEAEQNLEAQKRQQEIQAAKAELYSTWDEGLDSARERYPDFQEKGQEMIDSFADLDPNYGEFLTDTIMQLDNGHDVFYHLASNPDEAKSIVESGPSRAAIALGRLDARLAKSETKPKTTSTSKAPPPPPTNKGRSVAKPTIRGDEDDLAAVERALFSN